MKTDYYTFDMIFILAGISMFIGVSVFLYNRKVKSIPLRNRPKPFESFSFLFGVFINIPLFVMSIYSLYITRKTFLDAQVSGPLQQAALDGSRKALESVIKISKNQEDALRTVAQTAISQKAALDSSASSLKIVAGNSVLQQKILEKNFKVSSNQLDLIKEQRRIASLKPKLMLLINEQEEDVLAVKGVDVKIDSSSLSEYSGFNTFVLNVKVKNVGGALALSPLLIAGVDPESRFRTGDEVQYLNTNTTSFTKYKGTELPIFEDYRTYLVENVKISVPKNQKFAYVAFKIACYNVPNRIFGFRINIISK